jgi:UDP-N-acetylmuramate dehydrogenase
VQGVASPTPRQVSDAVIAIRRRKLPDPAEIGNAGSFFKNPVVPSEHCARLLAVVAEPGAPPAARRQRKAGGRLADRPVRLEGKSLGRAGVYPKQALVLVNNGGARGPEVLALARAIQDDVQGRFGVMLEPEPVMI